MSGIGPKLPPHLMKSKRVDNDEDETPGPSSSSSSIGPSLPPHLQKKKTEIVDTNKASLSVGPTLPPHLQKKNISDKSDYEVEEEEEEEEEDKETSNNITSNSSYGPALPPGIRGGKKDYLKKIYITSIEL